MREYETQGHSVRVAEMTVDFARILGLGEAVLANVRRGARLHNNGMLGIPDRILLTPETLTDEELAIVRQHPMVAYEHLSSIEFLKPALDVERYHHEKWDGTGFPYGLRVEQIPLTARLFALVDVWDSLRSDRPFRKGWPEDKIKGHLHDRAGKHLDPDLADKFLKLLEGTKRKQSESERLAAATLPSLSKPRHGIGEKAAAFAELWDWIFGIGLLPYIAHICTRRKFVL